MRQQLVSVADFSGSVVLLEHDVPAELRAAARSVPIPPGWFASRSYRTTLALVATGSTRVGVDLEIIDPLVVPDAVLTKDEQSLAATVEDLCAWWSAKEALAKALGDARNYDPRRLGSPALWKNGCEGRWTARQIFVSTGVIGWIVWESDQAAVARHFGASAR